MGRPQRKTAVRKIPHCLIRVFRNGKQIKTLDRPVYYNPFAQPEWKLTVRYEKLYRPVTFVDLGVYRLDLPLSEVV